MKPKKDRKTQEKLRLLNQTRERTPMPRPVAFDDKSKYRRSREKQRLLRSLAD